MDCAAFLLLLTQIVGVNLVLSADNAVVIALAARSLPPTQQKHAIVGGAAAAVALRITLTIAALELLKLPYLKLAGGALLLWIAVKLLLPDRDDGPAAAAKTTVASAITAILLADLVMSLDNVLAVAAAAKGSVAALALGLALSIPLVVLGAALLVKVMQRWPAIVTLGAALIGWVAGELIVAEPAIAARLEGAASGLRWLAPAAAALAVVLLGKALAARRNPAN
jgi:YjbE family integral membrane protein